MHLLDLRHNLDHDEMELGIRVASAFYLENAVKDKNVFIKVLNLRHRMNIRTLNRQNKN